MSAFTVGKQTAKMADPDTKVTNTDPESGPGEAFVKWIPGDAIVLYTALLALGAKQSPLPPEATEDQKVRWVDIASWEWFSFALIAAGVLVIVGAYAKHREQRLAILPLIARVALTLAAFTIWTTLLPGSWTYNWYMVRDLGDAYVLVIGIVAVVFTAVAERLTHVCDKSTPMRHKLSQWKEKRAGARKEAEAAAGTRHPAASATTPPPALRPPSKMEMGSPSTRIS
jgi:hypothetical protein